MCDPDPDPSITFTVVSCHFGDLFWIEQLAALIDATSPPGAVPELVVVNQDRNERTARRLRALPRVGRVLEYAPHAGQFAVLGHDHPNALNSALRERFTTSHVIVMDSDALPVGADWVGQLSRHLATDDCVLALDRAKWGLSHPCFMAIPVAACGRLDFAEGVEEVGLDTGRLVALQLVRLGWTVEMLRPTRGFSGRRGDRYLDGAIHHHGSGSFSSSADARLSSQVKSTAEEEFFRRRIRAGRFHLSIVERWSLAVRRHLRSRRRWARTGRP